MNGNECKMRILLLGEIEFTTEYYKKICEINAWEIDNVRSSVSIKELDLSYDLYILSDYPSSNLALGVDNDLVKCVNAPFT